MGWNSWNAWGSAVDAQKVLVVGTLGWGPSLRPTPLTPNEQLLHLALRALQAGEL